MTWQFHCHHLGLIPCCGQGCQPLEQALDEFTKIHPNPISAPLPQSPLSPFPAQHHFQQDQEPGLLLAASISSKSVVERVLSETHLSALSGTQPQLPGTQKPPAERMTELGEKQCDGSRVRQHRYFSSNVGNFQRHLFIEAMCHLLIV